MTRRITALTLTTAALFVFGLAPGVQGQAYPNRPIRLIAPFPAGGLADVLARLVGDEMSRSLGQPLIVENRAGAGGNTGADAVAKAEPDGYTLLMSSAGILTANQFLYAKMPFDPETAFMPISVVAAMSMLVVVTRRWRRRTCRNSSRSHVRDPKRSTSDRPEWVRPGTSAWRCSCARPASGLPMFRTAGRRRR